MTRWLPISDDLLLPLDVVTQKLAFLGRTGSGKSYAATKLAELMLAAGAQVVALDPVGIWYGLRLGDGFNVPVLGGLHGDLPLEPTAGALLADVVVERGTSAILDVSAMLSSEQARFAGDFATRFFERKKASPAAVHLFVEECQEFVPQNVQPGEQRMVHAFERLIKLGRNFGVGVSLISQRPQEVNKKALNQTECLFAFQMTGPQERKAIEGWVSDKGLDDDLGALLPKLAVGQPHVWSPQWLQVSKTIRIAKKQSLDASSTPKVGESKARETKLGAIDLDALKVDMAATIEKAKQEDPKELRAQIAGLQKQLRGVAAPTPLVRSVPVFDEAAWTELRREIDQQVTLALNNVRGALQGYRSVARDRAERAFKIPTAGPLSRAPTPPSNLPNAGRIREPVERPRSPTGSQANGSVTPRRDEGSALGNTGLRRILVALAQRPHGLTNPQIGVRAGMAAGGGSFRTYLSKARTEGWIEDEGPIRRITEAGLAALGQYDPLPTGRALLDYWVNELGQSGASRILRVAADAYPESLDLETLAERSGMDAAGGSFRTYMSKLRTLELVQGGRGKKTTVSEELVS